MRIKKYEGEKTDFTGLLLLADESRDMIDRYLDRGEMYILEDEGIVKGECVITDEGGGILEIKNIAVLPRYSRKGYGRAMIDYRLIIYPLLTVVLSPSFRREQETVRLQFRSMRNAASGALI